MGKEMSCNQSQSFLIECCINKGYKLFFHKTPICFGWRTISRNYTIASNVGVFEEHHVLLNLLVDVISNILSIHISGDKGNEKWYHASKIKLFEVVNHNSLWTGTLTSSNWTGILIDSN